MLTNWIPMRRHLDRDIIVKRIAKRIGITPIHATGVLLKAWSLADEYGTSDGDDIVIEHTAGEFDEEVDQSGFADALQAVGWLDASGEHVRFIGLEAKAGKPEKRRLAESRRKAMRRAGIGLGAIENADGRTTADKRAQPCGQKGAVPRTTDSREQREQTRQKRQQQSARSANAPIAGPCTLPLSLPPKASSRTLALVLSLSLLCRRTHSRGWPVTDGCGTGSSCRRISALTTSSIPAAAIRASGRPSRPVSAAIQRITTG